MVSLIIPVYNSETKLESCIKSVLKQTYKDFELILVDDGSTDHSLDICRRFEKSDARVRAISQKNSGPSAARNKGIENAKGQYIQFIDSDDQIVDTMVEDLVDSMEKNNVDMVVCGIREQHPDHIHDIMPLISGKVMVNQLGKVYPEIFQNFILNAPVNKLYKKEKIQSMFPEDLSLGEDLIFNLEYLKNSSSLFFLKKIYYYYEIVEGSLNRRYREDSIEIAERLYTESMRFSKDIALGELSEIHISKIFLQFMFYGMSDMYACSGKTNKEKKELVKKWVNNRNVRNALNTAKMPQLKQKIAQLLLKFRLVSAFHIMMQIKK